MLAAFLRLFVVVLVLAGIVLLFAYAFVAALIVTPILFVLFWLFGRRSVIRWSVVRAEPYPHEPPRPPGPVIEHDPNDLPRGEPPR